MGRRGTGRGAPCNAFGQDESGDLGFVIACRHQLSSGSLRFAIGRYCSWQRFCGIRSCLYGIFRMCPGSSRVHGDTYDHRVAYGGRYSALAVIQSPRSSQGTTSMSQEKRSTSSPSPLRLPRTTRPRQLPDRGRQVFERVVRHRNRLLSGAPCILCTVLGFVNDLHRAQQAGGVDADRSRCQVRLETERFRDNWPAPRRKCRHAGGCA